MERSEYFFDSVLKTSFKGYYYDINSSCVKMRLSLNQEEFESIASRYNSFGFSSREKVTTEIYNILNDSVQGFPLSSISLKDIYVGSKLKIVQSYGHVLELLTVGLFHFIVYNDESMCLLPGDELTLLDNGFAIGNSFIAKVKRDGQQYPDNIHYYESDLVSSIIVCNGLKDLENKIQRENFFSSKSKIYAWLASSDDEGNVWIDSNQLTDSSDAFFELDLLKGYVSINTMYNKTIYHSRFKLNIEKDLMGLVFPDNTGNKDFVRSFDVNYVDNFYRFQLKD